MANELNTSLGLGEDNVVNLDVLDKQQLTAALANYEEYIKRVEQLKAKGVKNAEVQAAREAVKARQEIFDAGDAVARASRLKSEAESTKAAVAIQKEALARRMADELEAAGTNEKKKAKIQAEYAQRTDKLDEEYRKSRQASIQADILSNEKKTMQSRLNMATKGYDFSHI